MGGEARPVEKSPSATATPAGPWSQDKSQPRHCGPMIYEYIPC